MSNEISNIRHTDRHTIPVEGFSFYKLITYNNLGIIELVIQSLPDNYIVNKDAKQLKAEYFQSYEIEENRIRVIKKPKEDMEEEIPF